MASGFSLLVLKSVVSYGSVALCSRARELKKKGGYIDTFFKLFMVLCAWGAVLGCTQAHNRAIPILRRVPHMPIKVNDLAIDLDIARIRVYHVGHALDYLGFRFFSLDSPGSERLQALGAELMAHPMEFTSYRMRSDAKNDCLKLWAIIEAGQAISVVQVVCLCITSAWLTRWLTKSNHEGLPVSGDLCVHLVWVIGLQILMVGPQLGRMQWTPPLPADGSSGICSSAQTHRLSTLFNQTDALFASTRDDTRRLLDSYTLRDDNHRAADAEVVLTNLTTFQQNLEDARRLNNCDLWLARASDISLFNAELREEMETAGNWLFCASSCLTILTLLGASGAPQTISASDANGQKPSDATRAFQPRAGRDSNDPGGVIGGKDVRTVVE